MKKIKIIDFDSGCGGFTKGLEDSNLFEVVYNGSINEKNKLTYNKTHINDFNYLDIFPKNVKLAVFTPNLGKKLYGIGKKNFNISDVNNFLALLTIRDIDNVIFITNRNAIPLLHQNSEVFLTKDNFPTRDLISCGLIKLGYNTFNFILDGAGFGLPQHKYYNIYWGSKNSDENIIIKEGFGMYKRPYRTPKHLLKGIDDNSVFSWHTPDYTRNYKGIRVLSDKLSRPLSYDFYNSSSNAPSIHPYYNRPLTIREGARLFGLTDDFDWDRSLSKREVAMMIYNSFPPFISKLMANKIKKAIK